MASHGKFKSIKKKIVNKDNLFSPNKGFGLSKPEAIQLLKKVISILNDFNLNYFLISGTLLGYVRHRDFIPWDDDIDLLVERKIFDILPDIIQNDITIFSKQDYDVIKMCHKNGTPILKDKFGWGQYALAKGKYCWPFIDLFPYDLKGSQIKFFKRKWENSEFSPAKKVEFLGIEVCVPKNPDYFLNINYGPNYMTEFVSSNHCHKLDASNKEIAITDFRSLINSGVDVKILQYSEHAREISEDRIDLKQLIDTYLIKKESKGTNCVLINLEKDVERYNSAISELEKISFKNFVHLKGTYWKNRSQFETDLTFVKDFLNNFKDNDRKPIQIDDFSIISDPNIHIQDGPLACYCSHLRGMIYGYLNFEDYTIIAEDDICITNTKNIEKYLKQVPEDWDVVCLNCRSKKEVHTEPFYKLESDWHSTHFYIINHKCLPFLFKHFYPITDQVDVLISDQTHNLNIYNITDSVYQKNIATNTQNNLHVIFNSPHYAVVRAAINRIENLCFYFMNKILPDNEKRNDLLVTRLMYDVLYNFITKVETGVFVADPNREDFRFDDSDLRGEEYEDFVAAVEFFLQCGKKGIVTRKTSEELTNTILWTISKFKEFHNVVDPKHGLLKAYDFGASAHVYFAPESNMIIKQYNPKLRWTAPGHENSRDIFTKETEILKDWLGIQIDEEKMQIRMPYWGESLYNEFKLPSNWKDQLRAIFDGLASKGINYSEFRLQNILVLDDIISFVDYGLATPGNDNEENYNRFVSILEKCEQKFKDKNHKQICELYSVLERNIGL